MIPTLVREPFHRNGWVYEEKVDGYRMLAYKDGAKTIEAKASHLSLISHPDETRG